MLAVVASSGVGLVVDCVVFLSLAFGSLEFLAGQVVGKALGGAVRHPADPPGCAGSHRRPRDTARRFRFRPAAGPDRAAPRPAARRRAPAARRARRARRTASSRDLPALLRPGDVLVANDTRVIPAQLDGTARRGADRHHARPAARRRRLARAGPQRPPPAAGRRLSFDGAICARRAERDADGGVALRRSTASRCRFDGAFERAGRARAAALHRPARRPDRRGRRRLPDHLRRHGTARSPRRPPGCTSRPRCWRRWSSAASRASPITLHVGAGTFLPVRTDDVAQHRMHAERGEITRGSGRGDQRRARAGAWRVGTTSSACWRAPPTRTARSGRSRGDTALFIAARLPLPRGRSAADQLPSAALDPVHAGLRLRRHRADARRLCARDRRGLPLLLLRRRLPAGARSDASRWTLAGQRRRRARRRARTRRMARSRRRPSCRSAPPAR